jgi:purine nucleosidase
MHRIVLDTDIGTDVDDLLALAMVPGRPDIDLAAVTVVYGDTDLRARLAATVCRCMGLDVPVRRGVGEPLSGREVMWAGFEGEGVDGIDAARYDDGDAVDLLVELAAQSPGTIDLVAVGPLTNVAAALSRDPRFGANLRSVTVMGGEVANGWPEHNFTSDARAAEIVLGARIPVTVVPLDQTLRVRVTVSELEEAGRTHPLGRLLAEQASRFWAWLAGRLPGVAEDAGWAHDPTALVTLLEPDLISETPMALTLIDPAVDGRLRWAPDPSSPIRVVTDLDADGVRAALLAAWRGTPT